MPYGPLLLTAGRASRLLKAMGNERRLAMLCHLSEREHSVTELCNLVGLSQSALSQHLAKLRRDNLVKTRRSAQTVYYSVASPEVAPLLQSLRDIFAPAAAKMAGGRDTALERPSGSETTDERAVWRKADI
ncbi:MAG: ArsR/SmtB family transcription factor [Kiloniellaceae bacterium]